MTPVKKAKIPNATYWSEFLHHENATTIQWSPLPPQYTSAVVYFLQLDTMPSLASPPNDAIIVQTHKRINSYDLPL